MQALSWIREFPWGTEMRKHEEKDGVRNGGHGQGSTVQRLKVHENTKYTHAWKQEVERFELRWLLVLQFLQSCIIMLFFLGAA